MEEVRPTSSRDKHGQSRPTQPASPAQVGDAQHPAAPAPLLCPFLLCLARHEPRLSCAGQETVGQQGWLWEQESGVRWGRQKGEGGGVLRDWLKEKALRKQDYEQENNTEKKGRSCWSHDGCLHCRCTLQGDTARSPVWAAVPSSWWEHQGEEGKHRLQSEMCTEGVKGSSWQGRTFPGSNLFYF